MDLQHVFAVAVGTDVALPSHMPEDKPVRYRHSRSDLSDEALLLLSDRLAFLDAQPGSNRVGRPRQGEFWCGNSCESGGQQHTRPRADDERRPGHVDAAKASQTLPSAWLGPPGMSKR